MVAIARNRRDRTPSEVSYERLSGRYAPLAERHGRRAEVALYVATAAVGWWVRMVQDDAFISFRYARNLAQGHGLVFNPGERVEGFTNFLWTLLMWVPEELGWDTASFSQFVTIPLMVATVALSLRVARRAVGDEALALLCTAVLVANMTFLAYGTSGLETMLQTFLVTAIAFVLLPAAGVSSSAGRRLAAGVLGAVAVLTRIDSVVLVGSWFLVHLWFTRPSGTVSEIWKPTAARALQLGMPIVVLLTPWLVWKADYYGELLPNTLAAKSAGNPLIAIAYGVFYLLGFFASYAAFLLIGRWRRVGRGFFELPATRAALAVVPPWFLYICWVGGDFMEYRFVVPVLPLLALLAGFLVDHLRTPRRHLVLAAVLLVASGVHRIAPAEAPIWPVLTFENLKRWPDDSANGFVAMGRLLNREFPGGVAAPDQVTIAIIPAGVVPYYAELPSIDMLGLNDRSIAEDGFVLPLYYPGHVRTASIPYLLERNVNLMIGAPQLVEPDPSRTSYRLSQLTALHPGGDLANLPDDAVILEIPLIEGSSHWQVLYLTPHPAVDAAIERNGWRRVPIERVCDPDDIISLMRSFARRTCPDL